MIHSTISPKQPVITSMRVVLGFKSTLSMYLWHHQSGALIPKKREEEGEEAETCRGFVGREEFLCLGFHFILVLEWVLVFLDFLWVFACGERKSTNARKRMETNFEIQPHLLCSWSLPFPQSLYKRRQCTSNHFLQHPDKGRLPAACPVSWHSVLCLFPLTCPKAFSQPALQIL